MNAISGIEFGFIALFIAVLTVLALHYAWTDYRLWRGLVKTGQLVSPATSATPKVSILLSARNEETHLAACLESILQQNYEGDWDIWVADDRSGDGTPIILAQFAQSHPDRLHFLRIETIPAATSPKKYALSLLAEKTNSDILLLTDADCLVQPGWITGIASHFVAGVRWVSGHSYIHTQPPDNLPIFRLQALDFLSSQIVSAGSMGMGLPITSCGNNLAYRREFYDAVGGFTGVSHILSGDDDLLLQKLARLTPWAARFCADPSTSVMTYGKATFRELWEQRKRWASKTIHYAPRVVRLLTLVFAFYVAIPIGAVLAWAMDSKMLAIASFMAFVWKTAWDWLVMQKGMVLLQKTELRIWFYPMSLLHIPMVIGAVLFGIVGKFRWK